MSNELLVNSFIKTQCQCTLNLCNPYGSMKHLQKSQTVLLEQLLKAFVRLCGKMEITQSVL